MNMSNRGTIWGAVALLILIAGTSARAELQGRWIATATASMAITGDITLNGGTLTFGNGAKLALTKVADGNGHWTPVGGSLPGTIYKLSPPSDPVLLNGNTLCGMKEPVTYVVLSEPYKGGLALSVFNGRDAPQGFGVNSCAAYFYER